MKFNIFRYNQRKALVLGLDLKDLCILEWIQDFWPRMKKIAIEGEEYAWLNYKSLIEDIPIIEISTPDGLYRRLKPIVKIGILKHQGVKDKKGSFSYYRITEKVVELFDDQYSNGGADEKSDPPTDEKSDGTDEKSDRVRMKSRNKDNPTNNNHTISISSIEETQKYFSENDLKSDPKEFWDHWESTSWMKGKSKITNRVAQARIWESYHEKKYPEKHKTTLNGANSASTLTKEPKELTDLRDTARLRSDQVDIKACQHLDFNSLSKTKDGYEITARSKKAAGYVEILDDLNINLKFK